MYMKCDICGIKKCTPSSHYEAIRAKERESMSSDVEVLRKEIQDLQDNIQDLKYEIDSLKSEIIGLERNS